MTTQLANSSLSMLRQRTTRLTNAWRLDRADGVSHWFTVHDQTLNQSWALGFDPRPGCSSFANRRVTGVTSRTTELSGLIGDDGISYDDLMQGRVWGARVKQVTCDWAYPWVANVLDNNWYVGAVEFDDTEWRLQLVGITSRLMGKRGETFGRTCQNQLGVMSMLGTTTTASTTSTCPVQIYLYPFQVAAAVVQAGATKRTMTLRKAGGSNGFGHADHATYTDYFTNGYVVMKSGDNLHIQETIHTDVRVDAQDRTITLMRPLPATPQSGDTVNVFAGCDKNLETCRDKFNVLQGRNTGTISNWGGFRGFPEIPGTDQVIKYPLAPGR